MRVTPINSINCHAMNGSPTRPIGYEQLYRDTSSRTQFSSSKVNLIITASYVIWIQKVQGFNGPESQFDKMSISLFETLRTLQECTAWFGCIQANLPKPIRVIVLCPPYLKIVCKSCALLGQILNCCTKSNFLFIGTRCLGSVELVYKKRL